MNKEKLFHLYVIAPDAIPEAEPYYLITPNYCLLYTQTEQTERAAEVKDLAGLPTLAREWLADCIDDLRRRYLRDRQEEVLAKAKRFTERLSMEIDAELAKEQTKQ